MGDNEYDIVKENLENVEFNNEEEDMDIIEEENDDDSNGNDNKNKLLIICFIIIGILLLIIFLFVTGVFNSNSNEPKKEDITPLEKTDKSVNLEISQLNSNFLNDTYLSVLDKSTNKYYITDFEGNVVAELHESAKVYVGKTSYVVDTNKDNKVVISRIDKDRIVDVIKESNEDYGGLIFDDNNIPLGFYKNKDKEQDLYVVDNNSTREIIIKGKKIINNSQKDSVAYNGRYIITVSNDKYGLYDIKDNKELIEPKYDNIKYLNNDIFSAIKNLNVGVINKNDEVLLDFNYLGVDYYNGLYFVSSNSKIVAYDSTFKSEKVSIETDNVQNINIEYIKFKDNVIIKTNDGVNVIAKDYSVSSIDYDRFATFDNYLVAAKNGSSIVTLFDSTMKKVQDFDTKRNDSNLNTAAVYLNKNFIINNNKLYDMNTGNYRFGVESLTRSYKSYEVKLAINGDKANASVFLDGNQIGSIEGISLIDFLHADNNGIIVNNNYFVLSVGDKNLIIKK